MNRLENIDPFSEDTLERRYEFFEAMRDEAPVFEAAPGVYFVGGYDTVNQVLRDTRNFSSGNGAAFLNFQGEAGLAAPSAPPPEIAAILAESVPERDTLLSGDPPSHTRFRSLVNRSLSPNRVAKWEPVIRKVVDELIDDFIDAGKVELVSQFAQQVPLIAIAMVLGVPPEDRDKYKDWSIRTVKNLAGRLTYEDALDAARATRDLRNYLRDRVQAARLHPEDNVVGDLVNAHMLTDVDGDEATYRPLDTPEIVSILQQLLVAGQETVNYLIGSLTMRLVEDPEQAERIRRDPSLVPALVEEGIRVESPIQALGRFCVNDTKVGDVTIPAGSRVVILYGSANRDVCRFAAADRLDIDRKNIREHVGFGAGPHYCVGSALARMESRIAFEQLLARTKNLRFPAGRNDFTHKYNFIFRALNELHLEFDKA